MSGRRPMNFWVMAAAGLFAGAWLLWAMVEAAAPVVREGGAAALAADPTFQHKLGELMVAVPLFMAALLSPIRSGPSIARFLRRAWPLTILGGALNLVAWFGTADRAPWTEPNRLWFMLLVVVGLIGAPLLARAFERRAGPTAANEG